MAKCRDVWHKLETNWIHFFWMTGETPQSLSQLAYQLERKFEPHVTSGRKSNLDFRNKVCSFCNSQYFFDIFFIILPQPSISFRFFSQ